MGVIKQVVYFSFFTAAVIGLPVVTAQTNVQKLETKVTVRNSNTRLDTLLSEFSKQTGIEFSFNSKKIRPSTLVWLKNENQTLQQSLEQIKNATGINYLVIGNHVVLVDKDPVSKNKITPALRRPVRETTGKGARNAGYNKKTIPHILIPAGGKQLSQGVPGQKAGAGEGAAEGAVYSNKYIKTDSLPAAISQDNQDAKIDSATRQNNVILRTIAPNDSLAGPFAEVKNKSITQKIQAKKQEPQIVKDASVFFLKPGISSNETFYCSPTFEIGARFLYGHISWNTNFKAAGFRYGIGTSLRLKDDLYLHIKATYGKLSKSFGIDSLQKVVAKNKLTCVSFLFEKKFNNNLRFQFGPVINYLSTYYYKNDQPFSFSNPVKNSEKPFYIVKPPYFLINSYTSGSVANVKFWAGVQVGVFYTIPVL